MVGVKVRVVVGSGHVFAWNASRLRAKERDGWENRKSVWSHDIAISI